MPIDLYIAYGCFHTTVAKLSSCDRDPMAAKPLNYLDLYRKKKCLLTSGQVQPYHYIHGETEVQIREILLN